MTKTTPRGPTPSLIGGTNGRPRRVAIARKSTCYRCHVDLLAGATCVEIPKLGAAYSSARRVCDDCFRGIVEKTSADLEEIRAL